MQQALKRRQHRHVTLFCYILALMGISSFGDFCDCVVNVLDVAIRSYQSCRVGLVSILFCCVCRRIVDAEFLHGGKLLASHFRMARSCTRCVTKCTLSGSLHADWSEKSTETDVCPEWRKLL